MKIEFYPEHLAISELGKIARDTLAQSQHASVFGITSRGIFLRLSSGWIVFLSFESSRGPLTLNFHGEKAVLRGLEIGAPARFSQDILFFPTVGCSILISKARLWQAPAPPKKTLPQDQRRINLLSVYQLMNLKPPNSPIASLLPQLLGKNMLQRSPASDAIRRIIDLHTALQKNQVTRIVDALVAFLGFGTGLTPSGDDLVTGFLLAANRWGEQLIPALQAASVNQPILEGAKLLTSTLSANLIECACQGQADERLILALDGIISGESKTCAMASALASWGSSSGFDALVGMALIVVSSNARQ